MELALGTVQFGLDYGISNQSGRVPSDEVAAILKTATVTGISLLDTAPSYGCSESVLGKQIGEQSNFRIVSKTPVFREAEIGQQQLDKLSATLNQTVARFNNRPLYGLLLHHSKDAMKSGGDKLLEAMTGFRESGLVERIGISVDLVDDIDDLLGHFDFDIIQAPLNVLNQRLVSEGYVNRLKARNVEIHARSLFLQGLVFMDPDQVPPTLKSAAEPLRRLRRLSAELEVDICTLALAFAAGQPGIDFAVVGVTMAGELTEIHQALENAISDRTISSMDFSVLGIDAPHVTTPSSWQFRQ